MADTTKCLKGTKTQGLLANSFMAEAGAVSRYQIYASVAEKQGYYQYADIFKETATNELRHAKIFLGYLDEEMTTPDKMGVDDGILSDTLHNLKISAKEEENDGVKAYHEAAKVAEAEGFPEIAGRFLAIADAEQHHLDRFRKMIERIETDTVWKSEKPVKWQCQVCGYIYEGVEPPAKCPACYHPYQHFKREDDAL